jgi:hypothetical protein
MRGPAPGQAAPAGRRSARPLPAELPGGLAPHNILVQPGGRVCLVDIEDSGSANPAAPASDDPAARLPHSWPRMPVVG